MSDSFWWLQYQTVLFTCCLYVAKGLRRSVTRSSRLTYAINLCPQTFLRSTKDTPNQVSTWHETAPSADKRLILVASLANRALYMLSVCVAKRVRPVILPSHIYQRHSSGVVDISSTSSRTTVNDESFEPEDDEDDLFDDSNGDGSNDNNITDGASTFAS